MASKVEYDLIVDDDNFLAIGKEYYEFGEKFEAYIDRYIAILNEVTNNGIKSGKVHDNLLRFNEAVNTLKEQGKDLSVNTEKCITDFLTDMDTADSYLY